MCRFLCSINVLSIIINYYNLTVSHKCIDGILRKGFYHAYELFNRYSHWDNNCNGNIFLLIYILSQLDLSEMSPLLLLLVIMHTIMCLLSYFTHKVWNIMLAWANGSLYTPNGFIPLWISVMWFCVHPFIHKLKNKHSRKNFPSSLI